MEGLVVGLIGAGLLAAWLLPKWRLRRALARPLSPAQLAILERNVLQYAGMDGTARQRLQRLVQQFLHEKNFVGCAGIEITEEMQVTIAAQACLLVLGRAGDRVPANLYPSLHAVLVYPGAFLVPRREIDAAGVVTEQRQDLLGESWGDGRVILSWDHVRRGGPDAWHDDGQASHNVVLHEFAHQLDSESGSTNGAPYLGSTERYRSWSEVLSRNYANLRRDAMWGQHGVLDHYGASSPAEFFAVATESFFEQPHAMAWRHPDLYEEFLKYFRLDPRAWLPEPAMAAEPDDGQVHYGQWR
ncbi:zinc-dependent peptidase [Massilia sp. G4R7]|uniref:Zinc-dependent peptidase n=1 Tax=Massilia phyllostachyos TaxID=2898585 RepID=A0ABS8Q3H4_9BURK|nr:M90 family metallopeptidase [Massilia phyllostachyos]MCD2516078.1 zinc-dependent peptidase [Massilia phyllostachyos]